MTPKQQHHPIVGELIDLIPLAQVHTADVVRLRNSPHVRAFFDEKSDTTADSQQAFLESYLPKQNDLYWVITLKGGKVIGTNRLYEIDETTGFKGSQTLDADYLCAGPYALEADLLVIDFAFRVLGLSTVRALIRDDNTKVVSFNLKLGFTPEKQVDLRGRLYTQYKLDRAAFAPQPLLDLVAYFARRAALKTS